MLFVYTVRGRPRLTRINPPIPFVQRRRHTGGGTPPFVVDQLGRRINGYSLGTGVVAAAAHHDPLIT
ncbi:hypothetical protein A9W96_29500 [Mycobacterium sp. 1245852.3]|nr:hypothetical protein A9W96_29500 [Mycobacterium sp. 1245852.3]